MTENLFEVQVAFLYGGQEHKYCRLFTVDAKPEDAQAQAVIDGTRALDHMQKVQGLMLGMEPPTVPLLGAIKIWKRKIGSVDDNGRIYDTSRHIFEWKSDYPASLAEYVRLFANSQKCS